MLLGTKGKWATMTLKIGLEDYVKAVIPPAQRGFVQGRSMQEHLQEVQRIQNSGRQGCWVLMDFRKAFDTVSHHMIKAWLAKAGLHDGWIRTLLSFLKGPISFIVGDMVTEEEIWPTGGIQQGDTLSPTLFVLLATILCREIARAFEDVKPFLYADDTLVWIPGGQQEVRAKLRKLKAIMKEYGKYTGQELNLEKTNLILQGDWGPLTITELEGIKVTRSARYLGWLLGKATPQDQYATALRKLRNKASHLRILPLSDKDKVKALVTWAYPVFDVVAQLVYPPEGVRREADDIVRKTLGVQNWSMTDSIVMQPAEEGGIDMIFPSTYLLCVHAKQFVRWMRDPDTLTGPRRQEMDAWREGRLGDRLSKEYVQLAQRPITYGEANDSQPWPAMATAAKAYGELGAPLPGLSVPREEVLRLPLWNSSIFRSKGGATYQNNALMEEGVHQVQHMITNGELDESKLRRIPHTWRDIYKTRIAWLVLEWASPRAEVEIPGPRMPKPPEWTLRGVAKAIAQAKRPQERQRKEVWQALAKLELPRKVERVVRTILWKKLPVADRMQKMQMSSSPNCPLCGFLEDHEHRVKKCRYLDRPISLIRGLYKPTTMATGQRVEPSRVCLDMPEISLKTEQGIFMWTAITALWRYRCEARYGRVQPSPTGYAAYWMGELGYWGREGPVTVPVEAAQALRKTIRMWLTKGKKMPQREEPGVQHQSTGSKEGQEARKQKHKDSVLQRHALDQPPPIGVQRVWTDGSQQTGIDGKEYAGFGVWFGDGHALNYRAKLQGLPQTNNRAEMKAAIHALVVTPKTVPLQLCVDSQLVTDGVTLWLQGWKRRGWKTKQNSEVSNKDLWQELASAMEDRLADTTWIKVPSHVGLHGNEMADQLADEGVLLHGVPIRGRESTTPQNLKRSREEMERQHEQQQEARQLSLITTDRRLSNTDKHATHQSVTYPVSTVAVHPASEPDVTGSNPGLGVFLQGAQPSQTTFSSRPMILLPLPIEETEGWQEMELKRRECFTAALRQKREMVQQHHLDVRQMALLLHLQLGWQQWHSQKEEWWNTAKEWTKGRRRAALQAEERRGREEIQGDREYWAIGVMMIHYEGKQKAMESEEKWQRMTLKSLSKEGRYRILQNTREREQRQTIVEDRLRGWERLTRRKQKEEEKEARRQIRQDSERGTRWQQYLEQRRVFEAEELKRRKLLEAGHRRLTNEMRKTQDLTMTSTDIEETRQYQVPLTVDLPGTVNIQRSAQFSSKRRRERPSDGRERSPKRKRRTTPE